MPIKKINPQQTQSISEKKLFSLIKKYSDQHSTFVKFLEQQFDWQYFKGETHFTTSLESFKNIIIEGDCYIDGDYIDFFNVHLIVIGNLTTNNLVSDSMVYVTGNLTVNGALTILNNSLFKVEGKTKVHTIIQNKSKVDIKNLNSNLQLIDGVGDRDIILRSLHEDLVFYDDGLFNEFPIDEEKFHLNITPDYHEVRRHLITRKLNFFRDTIADEKFPSDLIKAISNKTKSDEIIEMAQNAHTENLVKIILASRRDLPIKAQEILFNSNINKVTQSLARNPHIQETILLKLARLSKVEAQFVARNASCPLSVIQELIEHDDAKFRWVLTLHKHLDHQSIEKLAMDKDLKIRTSLFTQYSGYHFSDSIIESNLKINNPNLKIALVERNCNLTFQQYQTLLADSDENVLIETIENINNPSMFLAHKKTSFEEREITLYEFVKITKNKALKIKVLSFLPRKYHVEFVQKMSADDIVEFNKQLASNSSEKEVILSFLSTNKEIYFKHLASNFTLPIQVQKFLLLQFPSLKKINQGYYSDEEIEDSLQLVSNLLNNPQINKTTRTKLIKFCAGLENAYRFKDIIYDLFDLSENEINLLLQSKDEYLASTLISELPKKIYAPESAIKLMRFKEAKDQTEFEVIKCFSGEVFWHKLAKAQSTELKKIAAVNQNTSLENLLELKKDKDLEQVNWAFLNPKYPKQLLKNEEITFIAQLNNPNYSFKLLTKILNDKNRKLHQPVEERIRTLLWLHDRRLKANSIINSNELK